MSLLPPPRPPEKKSRMWDPSTYSSEHVTFFDVVARRAVGVESSVSPLQVAKLYLQQAVTRDVDIMRGIVKDVLTPFVRFDHQLIVRWKDEAVHTAPLKWGEAELGHLHHLTVMFVIHIVFMYSQHLADNYETRMRVLKRLSETETAEFRVVLEDLARLKGSQQRNQGFISIRFLFGTRQYKRFMRASRRFSLAKLSSLIRNELRRKGSI